IIEIFDPHDGGKMIKKMLLLAAKQIRTE
ncbi:uncharacterized protein METZ01_LOCUS335194, partial [marine metagenome]